MALSQRRTTLAALRLALGRVAGQEGNLSKASGIPVSTLKKIGAGIRPMNETAAHKLAGACGVSAEWLLHGEPGSEPVQANGMPVTEASARDVRAYSKARKTELEAGEELLGFGNPARVESSLATMKVLNDAQFFASVAVQHPQSEFVLWRMRNAVEDVMNDYPQIRELADALARTMEIERELDAPPPQAPKPTSAKPSRRRRPVGC